MVPAQAGRLCTLAFHIRKQKKLTYKQVAERGKIPIGFVRDLEACKIHNPDSYLVYCLSFGVGIPYARFEKRADRLARTPLDEKADTKENKEMMWVPRR